MTATALRADPVQVVLDALSATGLAVKPAGAAKWTAQCPAHEDRHASLSVARGDNGGALVHCHAGCATEAVCKALGLTLADLMLSDDTRHARRTTSKALPTCRFDLPCLAAKALARATGGVLAGWWPYFNADDGEALTVLRFNLPGGGKTFRPICPHENGWTIGDPPGTLPLYRLAALRGAARVWVVEGEKCADAAAHIGLTATTSAHGAKAAARTDWRPLAGRDVAIVPDDDAAGQGYAHDVATILTALDPPARVRIIRLPDVPQGGDVVDWLGPDGPVDAHTAEEIVAMLETQADATAPWRPPADEDDETPVLRRAADVQRRPLSWKWHERIPDGKVSLIAGHPGLGKTLLAVDLAARFSVGRDWPDGAPCETGNTIILSGEDDAEDTLCPRLLAAGADLARITFLDGVRWRDPDTKEIKITAVQLDRHIAVIRAAVTQTRAGLLVLDPVSSFLGRVDDHRNAELRALLSALASVGRETGCAIVCITHLRKAGGLAVHAAVGSLAYGAAARAVWGVLRDPQDAERRMFLPIKNNLARDSTGLGFRIETAPDGNGHPILAWEQDPITLRADDVLNPTAHPGPLPLARDEAAEWLTCALAQGPRNAKEIIAEAEGVGIIVGTLRRAKQALGVQLCKDGFQGPWVWRLPKVRNTPTHS